MKKVLVTGASGFIGGYIVEALLSQSYQVVGLDNLSKYGQVLRSYDDDEKYTFVKGDATSPYPRTAALTLAMADADDLDDDLAAAQRGATRASRGGDGHARPSGESGNFVFARSAAELVERAVLKAAVEDLVSLFLNGVTFGFEEGEVFHQLGRLVEVGEDADAAALGRLEDRAEQADKVEGWELSLFGVKQDVFVEVGWETGG
jgi:NAD(P)-dependent dehydrogenase (short-subunit alcohol dehydrogenase family)